MSEAHERRSQSCQTSKAPDLHVIYKDLFLIYEKFIDEVPGLSFLCSFLRCGRDPAILRCVHSNTINQFELIDVYL